MMCSTRVLNTIVGVVSFLTKIVSNLWQFTVRFEVVSGDVFSARLLPVVAYRLGSVAIPSLQTLFEIPAFVWHKQEGSP